jgi:hypothetical protein
MDFAWEIVRPAVVTYLYAWVLTGVLWVLTKEHK